MWMVIDARGTARPCCHTPVAIGDITKQTVEEIWNGELMVRLRGAIRDGYIDPICRNAACTFVHDTVNEFGLDSYDFRCQLETEYTGLDLIGHRHFCFSGWSLPEHWGVWSDGGKAKLYLDLQPKPPNDLCLNILCKGVGTKEYPACYVGIEINGRELDRWKFRYPKSTDGFVWKTAIIPASILGDSLLEVCFLIERPLSPKLWNVDDKRELGIGISGLKVTRT
jgi:hypothetical protein